MKSYENDAQYTAIVHSVVKHKTQATLWDLLMWLDSDDEIQSVRDLLSYIRLFTDFGDNSQGRLFFDQIKGNKVLRLILPDIAMRLVSRGKATGATWLEDLGLHIQKIHLSQPHPGFASERDTSEH